MRTIILIPLANLQKIDPTITEQEAQRFTMGDFIRLAKMWNEQGGQPRYKV
jgi:hypothetical protein